MTPPASDTFRFGEFELSARSRMLLRNGQAVPVPSKSFEVLLYLVANPGRLITKDELMKAVWPDSFVEEGNLTQHVFRLRKVLQGQSENAPYIVTVPGQGYQFSAVVETQASEGALELEHSDEVVVQTIRERATVVAEEFLESAPRRQLLPAHVSNLRNIYIWTAAGLIVALAVWGFVARRGSAPQALVPIMVAPFDNRTGDSSFDLALSNALTIDMEQSPYFQVLSKADFRKTLGLMEQPAGVKLTDAMAREICQRSNSRILISGAIDKVGSLYPVTIEATECATGSALASERAEPSGKEDLLKSLDRLTADLRRRLGESSSSVKRFSVPLLPVESSSFDAVRDYSEAIDLYDRGRTDEAVAPLKDAIELDPKFALAWADLARMYDNMSEHGPAVESITHAYALRNTVGDRSRFPLMAAYYSIATGDLNEAMRSAQVWSETFPQDVSPWNDLANIQEQLGEFPQALVSANKAAEIMPSNAAVLTTLARAYYHVRRYSDAEDACRRAIARGTDSPGIHNALLRLAYLQGDQQGVEKQLAWSRTGLPERTLIMQTAALAFRAGRMQSAKESIERTVEEGNKKGLGGFSSLYGLEAYLSAMTGEEERARDLLMLSGTATDVSNGLVASALVGDEKLAESTVEKMIAERPQDTLLNYVYAPQVRAATALRHNRPKDAIEALGPALAYEMRDFHIPSLLGMAYLAAGMPADAERTYRKIVDNPGIDPLSLQYPVARLGLARALAGEGRRDDSRREYERFFDDWKTADADLPIVQKAHEEYQSLATGH